MKGRIDLYHLKDDTFIGGYSYKDYKHRKRIIDIWKSRYKEKFNHCYIHIIPNADEQRVKSNGRNLKKKRSHMMLLKDY